MEDSDKIVKKFLQDVNPENIYKLSFEFIPLFWSLPVFYFKENLEYKFTPYLIIKNNQESHLCIDSNHIFGCPKSVLKKYNEGNHEILQKVNTKYKEEIEKVDKLYGEVISNTDFHETGLKDLLEEGLKIFKEFFISTSLAYLDNNSILDIIGKDTNLNEDSVKKILEIDTQKSFELINEENLLEFKEKDNCNYKKILYILTSYSHVPTEEEIKNKVKESSLGKLKEDISEKKRRLNSNLEKYNDLYKNLNQKEKKLVDFIQMIKRIREDRKQYFSKLFFSLYKISGFLLEKWGFKNVKNGNVFGFELLKGKDYIETNKRNILKREEEYALYYNNEEEPSLRPGSKNTEKALENLKKAITSTNKDSIRGAPAHKGKVSGKAVIAIKNEDFSKIKQGDILITSMTRPEVLPHLKKVKAIVTDEGGITCHAAIVSRELKKPCVIGTKNATQIFNDGENIEVDAYKGVVKKL